MPIPQNTKEEARLASSFDRNRSAYGRAIALGTGGQSLQDGDVRVWAAPFISVFNGLMSPRWKPDKARENFDSALRFYQRLDQAMTVSLGPLSQPDDLLRQLLKEHRFQCTYHVPFMHLDLKRLGPEPEQLPGISLRELHDAETVRDQELPWIGSLTTPIRRAKFRFLADELRRSRRRLWQFLVWDDSTRRVIGGVRIFRFRESAGIYDVEVARAYRRRGIATWMTHHACAYARSLGLSCACLSAAGQAIPVYQKVGFTIAGRWSDFFLGKARMRQLEITE